MHITMERVLPDEEIADLYPTYLHAWDPLLVHAAARHVLTQDEFAHEMRDPRIEKHLVRIVDGGKIVALTTITNDMSAIPWINAHHYRFRYPDAAARGALFYLGYTFVDRRHRHTNILLTMAQHVDRRLGAVDAVVGFDICAFNNEHGIGRRVARLFNSSDRIDALDTQSYYAADYRGVATPSPRTSDAADSYDVMTLAERPELVGEVWDLLLSRWPTFTMAGGSGHGVDLEKMLMGIADRQVLLFDAYDALCGVGLAVPLSWDGTVEGLPGGWDSAIRDSHDLLLEGRTPDTLCALSVTISPDALGYGLSSRVMKGITSVAARDGAHSVITPLRPSLKSKYPLIPMADYLTWRSDKGEAFDPWLRTHLRLGAKVLGISERSMEIHGSVSEWQEWLGFRLPASGEYPIDGGLVPLVVDREADRGFYCEPNVWVQHTV